MLSSRVLRLLCVAAVIAQAHLAADSKKSGERRLVNLEYAYAIKVPSEYSVIAPEAPAPLHGWRIPLPNNAFLWADGSYDIDGYASASTAANEKQMEYTRQYPGFRLIERTKTRLGNLSAIELVVVLGPASGNLGVARDLIIAYRGDRKDSGVVYTLGLQSTPGDLSKWRPLLNSVARRFELLKWPLP